MKSPSHAILLVALISAAVVMVAPYLVPLPAMEAKDTGSLAGPGGRLIAIGGSSTYVEEAGPLDGPVVLLIHGMGCSTFSWRHTLPALAQAGYRAIAFDQKGFGLSDKEGSTNYSHQSQVETTVQLMNTLGISKALVVGHSMGANVAAHLSISYPERVEKLAIVDGYFIVKKRTTGEIASTLLRFPPFRRWARLALRTLLTPHNIGRIIKSAYADPAMVTPDVVNGYTRPLHTADWDEAVLGIARDLGKSVLPAPLSSIKVPTLVIWGEEDRWVPLRKGKEYQQQFGNSELVTIPRAGHMPMEEKPERFNEELIAFLKR